MDTAHLNEIAPKIKSGIATDEEAVMFLNGLNGTLAELDKIITLAALKEEISKGKNA